MKSAIGLLIVLTIAANSWAYTPPFSGVQARTVVLGSSWFRFDFSVVDPIRNTTATGSSSSYSGGPASGNIYISNNVVIWIARNPTSNNIGFATYDAAQGAWKIAEFSYYPGNGTYLSFVADTGVVMWVVDNGTSPYFYTYTYSPTLGQWVGTSDIAPDSAYAKNTNYTVAAWRASYNNLNTHYAGYGVYDQRFQQWKKGTTYLPNSTFSVSGGTLTYFVSGQPQYIGYDPYASSGNGGWTNQPTKPLSNFHLAKIGNTAVCTETAIAAGAFLWDFGNGTTSTSRSPIHTYQSPGTYTITLTITGVNGGTDITTRQITI